MEQRSMGKFITALRKANGMTQKELAQRLNVSDKSVSRWECDNGAPDLALIPVLAEIFGVTCDELLRGERLPPERREEAPARGNRESKRLLKAALSRFRDRTWIAMGISCAGLIAALIGNLAFLRSVLGFLLGAAFLVAGVVCQAVFLNRAMLSVEDAPAEEGELAAYRRQVIGLAQRSFGLTAAILGFTFPLALVDAYVGLGADSLLLFGSMGAAGALLLWAVVLYFANWSMLNWGVYSLPEREEAAYRRNHRLKGRCAAVLAALLAATALIHHLSTAIWGPYSIAETIIFEDYESFIAFMEQEVEPVPSWSSSGVSVNATVPVPTQQVGEPVYYDEFGQRITEEEAKTRTLKDANGQVVCTYLDRNQSVVSLSWTAGEGTALPIYVRTQQAVNAARQTAALRHVLFAGIYALELLGCIVFYFKKRSRV